MSSNNLSIRTKRARSPSSEEENESNKRARTENTALPIRPRIQTQPASENDASATEGSAADGAEPAVSVAVVNVQTAPMQASNTNDLINNTTGNTSTNSPTVALFPPQIPTTSQLNAALVTLHAQDALEAFTIAGPAEQQQQEQQ